MPYDLYGNHYKSALEASNAEMAQCAEISQRYNEQRLRELEQKQQYPNQDIWQYIHMLLMKRNQIVIMWLRSHHGPLATLQG